MFKATHINGIPSENIAGNEAMKIAMYALIPSNSHPWEILIEGFSLQRFDFFLENFSININEKTIIKAIKANPIPLLRSPSMIQFSAIPVEIVGIFNNSKVPNSFIASMHIRLIPIAKDGKDIGNAIR